MDYTDYNSDKRCSHTRQFLILFNLLGVFSKICRNSCVNSEQAVETEGTVG